MFIGEFTHTIDDKKRLSIPTKFRKDLGKIAVVARGLDHCLFIYAKKEWDKIADRIGELGMGQSDTRAFHRFLFSGAHEVEFDAAGRLLIPDVLKDFAKLPTGKVVVAGVHNRIEVWQETQWNAYKERVERDADTLAEKLGSIGMI